MGDALSAAKINGPTAGAEELDAIRAYDSAQASGEAPISYEQMLRRIERSPG
jgi:hypothetical protein